MIIKRIMPWFDLIPLFFGFVFTLINAIAKKQIIPGFITVSLLAVVLADAFGYRADGEK